MGTTSRSVSDGTPPQLLPYFSVCGSFDGHPASSSSRYHFAWPRIDELSRRSHKKLNLNNSHSIRSSKQPAIDANTSNHNYTNSSTSHASHDCTASIPIARLHQQSRTEIQATSTVNCRAPIWPATGHDRRNDYWNYTTVQHVVSIKLYSISRHIKTIENLFWTPRVISHHMPYVFAQRLYTVISVQLYNFMLQHWRMTMKNWTTKMDKNKRGKVVEEEKEGKWYIVYA